MEVVESALGVHKDVGNLSVCTRPLLVRHTRFGGATSSIDVIARLKA